MCVYVYEFMCEHVVLAISSALPSPDCWPNCESPVLLYRCTSILNRAAPPAYISNSVYVISPSHYQVSIRTSGSFHFSLPPHPQVSSCIVFPCHVSCCLLVSLLSSCDAFILKCLTDAVIALQAS